VMPSKLLNIMAVARPVVVTAGPQTELAQVVLAAGCGEVVEPEAPPALAAGIRRLATDEARRRAMGPAGRTYVATHLDAESVLPRVARILRHLHARTRNGGRR